MFTSLDEFVRSTGITLQTKRKFPTGTKKVAPRYSVVISLFPVLASKERVLSQVPYIVESAIVMVEKSESVAAEETRLQVSHGDRRAHQKAIGQGLRKFFNAVVSEPIPDEFILLLQKMDGEKEGGSK